MPFTSVYHRVSKIETKSEEIAILIASVSKLGLVRVGVLATASPGYEEEVTRALKAPNIWRSIGRCEGSFTHRAIQLVPVKYLRQFREYVQELVNKNLITNFRMIYTADYVSNFPDFGYFDSTNSRWKFDWEGWFASVDEEHPSVSLDDPTSYQLVADKKETMIIRELELDARKRFVEIASNTGMSPQAVKYHYQKLVDSGVAEHYQFRVHPFPFEVSAYHDIMLEFNSKKYLDKFFSIVPKLFFVLGVAKVLRRNTVVVQTWMLESQLQNMFSFFSHMAKAGLLKSYAAVRMDLGTRETQTISDELFDDERGWTVDFEKCLSELPKVEKVEVTTQENLR